MIRITATMELLSDWHIGSGSSRGEADRAIALDRDGLPFVPYSTVGRLLATHCEQLAVGLGHHPGANGWRGVRELLGSSFDDTSGPATTQSALVGAPLRFSPALAAALAEQGLTQHARRLRSQTAIDEQTGTALDDHLRTMEVAPPGLLSSADWWLDAPPDDEATIDALCLLVAGAAMVERVGGKRRRGPGHCRLRLHGDGGADLVPIGKLDKRLRAGLPSIARFSGRERHPNAPLHPSAAPDSAGRYDDHWVEVQLAFDLDTPLAARTTVVGNLQRGADHIPGRTLLPLVLERLSPLLRAGVATHLRAGDLQVTHATPQLAGSRSTRLPLALAETKLRPGEWINRIVERPEEAVSNRRDLYITSTPDRGGSFTVGNASSVMVSHNTTDRLRGRPIGPSGVHAVEQLADRQTFRADLLIKRSALVDDYEDHIVDRVSGPARIGHRRLKGDQGIAEVTVRSHQRVDPPSVTLPAIVVCESDIVIDEVDFIVTSGRERLLRVLGRELGCAVSYVKGEPSAGNPAGEIVRDTTISGWNAAWQLPSTALPAVAAGTTFVIDVADGDRSLAQARLAQLTLTGIGDRRAEGHGRIRVCERGDVLRPNGPIKIVSGAVDQPTSLLASIAHLNERDRAVLAACQRSAWTTALRIAAPTAAAYARKHGLSSKQLPLNQVGNTRKKLAEQTSLDELVGWCDRQIARFGSERHRQLDHKTFYEWLRDVLAGEQPILAAFLGEHVPPHLRADLAVADAADGDLSIAYRIDAVRAVVAELAKSQQEDAPNGD